MPAYVIAFVEVTDPERYDQYKLLTPAAIAAYDGKFLIRGGEVEMLEGEEEPRRTVMLEFPTMERAREFWDSPQYREARAVREGAAIMDALLVPGAD